MTAHIHAALMAEYAKDATETDKPWERWERQSTVYGIWTGCSCTPTWKPSRMYRRKRTPLCQVEGRDVFPGDKLWSVTKEEFVVFVKFADEVLVAEDGWFDVPENLSWAEPPRTKTVYQWAFKNTTGWVSSTRFAATEEEWRVLSGLRNCEVRRLDYTAMEVPA